MYHAAINQQEQHGQLRERLDRLQEHEDLVPCLLLESITSHKVPIERQESLQARVGKRFLPLSL